MYESFFRLTDNPFRLTPDPRFLYFTPRHKEALSALVYGVLAHKGFLVVTGDAGTGKTTLIHTVLAMLSERKVSCAFIFHPLLEPVDFLEQVLLDLGVMPPSRQKGEMLRALHQFLLKRHQDRTTTALIIDEAHKLSPSLLEEVRLFSNLETSTDKLLQIVLAGQSELDELFRQEDMRQLKQRISIRTRLGAFSLAQTMEYLQHRLGICGRNATELFPPETLTLLYHLSRGVPRLVNSICDNCLLLAFASQSPMVTKSMMLEVAADLDLSAEAGTAVLQEMVAASALEDSSMRSGSSPNGSSERQASRPAQASGDSSAARPAAPVPTSFKTLESYSERRGTLGTISKWADRFR